MLDKLFGSKVRAAILITILSDLGIDYYSRLLEKVTGMDHKAIWKELNLLEKQGIISSYKDKKLKRYRVNRFPGQRELRNFILIVSGKQTTGKSKTRKAESAIEDSSKAEQLTLI